MAIRIARWGALAAAAALLTLTACSAPPPAAENGAGTPGASESVDFTACAVSDFGGLNDRGFNQAVVAGLQEAEAAFGVRTIPLESRSEADYASNLTQSVEQNCDVTITVGFSTADALREAAAANTDRHYAIIDEAGVIEDNVKPVVYDTAQASFLAGYLAAGYSSTGKVGVFGGQPFPPVLLFLDGFYDGVQQYNADNDAAVEVVGWNKESGQGSFAGTFTDIAAGKALTDSFIGQGVDVVLPVAGSLYQGAAEAIRDSGKRIALIGVDNDGAVVAPEYADLFLTSIEKRMSAAVNAVIEESLSAGGFSNTAYIGDLSNEGVAISDVRDFADELPDGLLDRIEELRAAIIAGEITVVSDNSPR